MLTDSYAISLLICSIASISLALAALRTGIRVLSGWNPTSDSAHQVRLESETWFGAQLVQIGLLLQIVSLVLLIAAADSFSGLLPGAMCAAGAFSANDYGLATLSTKIAGVFLFGFWIVLHRLDVGSETMGLTRIKFGFLLWLLPCLAIDLYFLFNYLANLEPDIITSCCGVLFNPGQGDGLSLFGPVSFYLSVALYLLFGTVLLVLSYLSPFVPKRKNLLTGNIFELTAGTLWLIFLLYSFVIITSVVSPYVYAMPSHRCPFDLLQKEYSYVGIPIYLVLFTICFGGASSHFAGLCRKREGMEMVILRYQAIARKICIVGIILYYLILSFYPARYLIQGGE